MTQFQKYSDDQKAEIVGCLKAAFPSFFWTGAHFKPVNKSAKLKVSKLKQREKVMLEAVDDDLSWAILELEAIAGLYLSALNEDPRPTKAQKRKIAKLSEALVEQLKKVSPRSLGFGTPPPEPPEFEIPFYQRKLGEEQLAALIKTMQDIRDHTSVQYEILGGSNAMQSARNTYLERVLGVWVSAGGEINGGPNSEMIKFLIAACRPVLGSNPTDDALGSVEIHLEWMTAVAR